MRFVENGPIVPDALLNARDDGRVVFFCGSGVSRAKAGLPDFFGLADAVLASLRVPNDDDASKVLAVARDIGSKSSVSGLISADRVFALLERQFDVVDIHNAVATALKPKPAMDLSPHNLLLRLAKTRDARIQLVTTNFDRLFEECIPTIKTFQPPRLPNLSRYDILDGIVYLHGKVNDSYSGADGEGFVLSSSDFGHAYLSEGWATEFFREIVSRNVVVFVGYSADDPPISYLLEGFRRKEKNAKQIYAFQSADSNESIARWQHKGVEPIAYSVLDHHKALWQTLEKWAGRADNPVMWRNDVIRLAIPGPVNLRPHERGQVVHVVSTSDGAKEFAKQSPSSEWLCVFDPACRFASPDPLGWGDSTAPVAIPFDLYGLDFDPFPQSSDWDSKWASKKDYPKESWDVFVLNSEDRKNLSDENFSSLRGHNATQIPRLPVRLEYLCEWLSNVSHEPATIWWAIQQNPLHPRLLSGIEWRLKRDHQKFSPAILSAWNYLFEVWQQTWDTSSRNWHDLEEQIKRDGWQLSTIRHYIKNTRPYLKASPAYRSTSIPPKSTQDLNLWDLIRLEVECSLPMQDPDIPDEWLLILIQGLRSNLEHAVQLGKEVMDWSIHRISPFNRDFSPNIDRSGYVERFSGYVHRFAMHVERLIQIDPNIAKNEFLAWRTNDDTAFCRLRLWIGGKPDLISPNEFFDLIQGLSEDAFWDGQHQRDLLLTLSSRWHELSNEMRKSIEVRLLRGPKKWPGENGGEYKERNAWATANRLQWLKNNNCQLTIDFQTEISKRRLESPKWKPEYSDHAADSREVRGGIVNTNTEHSALLAEPNETVIEKSKEISREFEGSSFEVRNPFAGLCSDRPVKALQVLALAARRSDYPHREWRAFLESDSRKGDLPKFSKMIAKRISRLPDQELSMLMYSSTWWLTKVAKSLLGFRSDSLDNLISRQIDVLENNPIDGNSAVVSGNRGRDWVTYAINSPAGHIAMVTTEDLRLDGKSGASAMLLRRLTRLLALRGDARRHSIALLCSNLAWFYCLDREWTEKNLLSVLDTSSSEDIEAMWAGIFSNPEIDSASLFLRLKPTLLKLVKERAITSHRHIQSITYLIFIGWTRSVAGQKEPHMTNSEMSQSLLHGGDDFRSQFLWQLERCLENADVAVRDAWIDCAVKLFSDVWPKQNAVKGPTTSFRLCELLLLNESSFSRLHMLVFRFLSRIDSEIGRRLHFNEVTDCIIHSYPAPFLELMYKALSSNVSYWSYGTGAILEKIQSADAKLAADTRLIELTQRWIDR